MNPTGKTALRLAKLADMEKRLTVAELALSDLAMDRVQWVARVGYSLGICRPLSACGGIVIQKREGSVSAHYWEDFHRAELAHIQAVITGADTPANRELLKRRAVIETAATVFARAQSVGAAVSVSASPSGNRVNPAVWEFTLPACWASYLINGDASGLEPGEKAAADKFLADENLNRSYFMDCGEQFFSSRDDTGRGLAGDVCLFTYAPRNGV